MAVAGDGRGHAVRPPTWSERPYVGHRGIPLIVPVRESLLVIGPTQSGKTSSVVIPSLLRWRGSAIVASVKDDVARATELWRRQQGPVAHLDPEKGALWDPVCDVHDWRSAWRVARDMTESPRSTGHGDHDFWSALAARYVAALLLAASEHALTTHEVATAVAQRVVPAWLTEVSDVVARDIAQGMAQLDGRTFDSIATTADVTLTPWLSPYRGLDVADVITRDGTVYLVAPRRDHATYESLFRGAVRAGLTAHERAGTSPLLLVLDEAASIAPLPDLDELAATASGLGVTLVTIFQDVSQITARFGERAATIVNNHRARMVIAGTSDPALSRLVPEVVGDDLATLRRLPARRARVISGSRPVATVWLRPWWKQRNLRARGVRARVEPWPSTTPAIPDW